jgi:two-component system cell cycle sensor histidine kinase/response regulator CckA
MTTRLRVLLVEDSENDATLTLHELRRGGYEVESVLVQDADALGKALEEGTWDIVLSDWSMPRFSALGALSVVKARSVDLPFLVVSGTVGEETAIAALRAGAHDFVVKGKLTRLLPAIDRELRDAKAREAHRRAQDALRESEKALRRSEDQLRQAQKMEAIGRLAGGVAHDFNNMLSVVLSYTGLILADMKSDDPLRPDLEEIRKAGERAAGLTRQLLAFSHQQVVLPKIVDLNQIVGGIETMLGRLLGADVEVTLLPAPRLGKVKADPGQVEQIVMNLVVNARDAMVHGGKLTIQTNNVDLDEHYASEHLGVTAGPHVMLAVTDSGVGMDKETQAQVFEPFFTTKDKGKGTGLGLSIVFGIVKQNGGHIWLYSEPGKGTTFKVYFPRTDETANPISSQPPGSEDLRGSETVLLVEDDEQVRAVARGILRRSGYTVLEAPGPGEALLVVEKYSGKIELLITDVVLPRMNGPELAERIRKSRPDMKVLFMSGYTDEAIIQHGILDSGVTFLQKPITVTSLTTKVREALGSRNGNNKGPAG